jgi:hypothetical protein
MSGVKKAMVSRRYNIAKALSAFEEVLSSGYHEVSSKGISAVVNHALENFQNAYSKQLTTVMYITGAAMAPTLNAKIATDANAYERLVMRTISRPSPRSVSVGDIVAFQSPIASPGSQMEHNVMVRRIAALEGHEMISESAADDAFKIPPGHCWLLADNEAMAPPAVIDSRTFGHLPLSNIMGRIIYFASSRTDHGPVINSPGATEADRAVVEGEVDIDVLFPEEKAEPKA